MQMTAITESATHRSFFMLIVSSAGRMPGIWSPLGGPSADDGGRPPAVVRFRSSGPPAEFAPPELLALMQ